jgi:hypothetical protein
MRTLIGGLLASCLLGCVGAADPTPAPLAAPAAAPAPPAPVAPPPPASSTGPQVLAEDVREPTAITVDADAVYWTSIGSDGLGGIVRWSKRDSSTTTLANAQAAPFALTSAGETLYWLNTKSGSGAVMSMPRTGGSSTTLAAVETQSDGLVLSKGSLFFLDGHTEGTISSVPATGGPKQTVAPVTSAFSLAYDGADFFYLIDAVMRVSPSGGAATRISDPCFYPTTLQVDESQVYWACQDGTLRAVAKTGGATRTLFSRNVGGGYIGGLVLDAGNVYFTSMSDGTVARVSKQGGPVTVLALGELTPGPIAVDDAFVYYGVRGRGGAKAAVKRIAK